MPITAERLNELLVEHEQCLVAIREIKEQIELLLTDAEYGDDSVRQILPFQIKGILSKINTLPDHLARIERKHYRSTIKRNINVRERMRLRRRQQGIPERAQPAETPQEVYADMLANREYDRLNTVPYGADGKPIIDPDAAAARERAAERKRSYVYDPDKPMDNASFLAMIGDAPTPKTPEEIAAEGLALLDSLPSDEPTTHAPAAPEGKSFLSPIEREICKDVLDK
jgi:hypothetical protein